MSLYESRISFIYYVNNKLFIRGVGKFESVSQNIINQPFFEIFVETYFMELVFQEDITHDFASVNLWKEGDDTALLVFIQLIPFVGKLVYIRVSCKTTFIIRNLTFFFFTLKLTI